MGDGNTFDFDRLCACGKPDCGVSRAAQIAKRLHAGLPVSAEEGQHLAEMFASAVLAAGEAVAAVRELGTMLELLKGEAGPPPPMRGNPFLN